MTVYFDANAVHLHPFSSSNLDLTQHAFVRLGPKLGVTVKPVFDDDLKLL